MELREFLNRVVGQGSITQNDEGQWLIKPYEVVITSRNSDDYVNGFISFKGERFQEFSGDVRNDLRIVNGLVGSLNHGYAAAIKDVVLKGNVGETIKPFKFV